MTVGRRTSTVFLGMGSNLGEREGNCRKALDLLSFRGIKVSKVSSFHETEPWGVLDQPKFINLAAEVETVMGPRELLDSLKAIEAEMGRRETCRWGPRIIDIDILFYDDLILRSPELTLPHPLMHEREFVLRPLAEIAPDKEHPVLKKTVKELVSELKGK